MEGHERLKKLRVADIWVAELRRGIQLLLSIASLCLTVVTGEYWFIRKEKLHFGFKWSTAEVKAVRISLSKAGAVTATDAFRFKLLW
jgi:hypothetical protein